MFDPFESRRCRDIRNDIGTAFVKAIEDRNLQCFLEVAAELAQSPVTHEMTDYISGRQNNLETLLAETRHLSPEKDFYMIAELLWKECLYFEAHEWMEGKWLAAGGDKKKALQAIIFAATALEQFQYKRTRIAKKLTQKAVERLKDHSEFLSKLLDVKMILHDLKQILDY